jgi:hypothetical protein
MRGVPLYVVCGKSEERDEYEAESKGPWVGTRSYWHWYLASCSSLSWLSLLREHQL